MERLAIIGREKVKELKSSCNCSGIYLGQAGKNRLLRWSLLTSVLLLLSSVPLLASAALGNAGMLALRDGLMAQADFAPGDYPFYGALDAGESTEHIAQTLRQAVTLNPGSSSLRWGLGRAALAVGDAQAAAGALEQLVEKATHQPLLYSDVLLAFSRGGRPEAATGLYELAPPPQQTRTISDTVALIYLEQGSQGALERAIALRPGDLYANYFLWKQAQEAGDMEAAATYSETLVYFPLEAVDPTDERLLDYAAEIIPNLLEDKLWNRDKTLNVVSFLVWQHHETPGVEKLLEQLAERYPTEPEWLFYLAELYHRRGDLEQAEMAYRQVLAVDPAYAQAYLRLGMVAEEARKRLSEAAGWYEQYNALSPDDLLGLKRLSEICTALESASVENGSCREAADRLLRNTQYAIRNSEPPAAVLRDALAARTDDRRIVAELLNVLVEDVELGPNLVENGGFEEWERGRPVGWQFWQYLGRDGNNRLYFAGEDNLIPQGSAVRIITLWSKLIPEGYAQYTGQRFPVTGAKYLLRVTYCAWHFIDGTGLFYFGENVSDGLSLAHSKLLDSHGQWSIACMLVDGPTTATSMVPMVRNWGIGDMWFKNVQIIPISCVEPLRD